MSLRIFAIVQRGRAFGPLRSLGCRPLQPMRLRVALPGSSVLHVAGSRSAQQLASASGSKFDASLAEIARHVGTLRPASALQDLHALNPAARFSAPGQQLDAAGADRRHHQGRSAEIEGGARGLGTAARLAVFQRCERVAAGRSIGCRHRIDRGPCHAGRDDAHQERRDHLAGRLCAEQRSGAFG